MTTEHPEALFALMQQRGHEQYTGEPVSHLEHALQCAALAQAAQAAPALVVAALLHDIGHLLHDRTGTPSEQGLDDAHERLAETCLAQWFGPDVTRPIALHVQAKRYLAHNPAYFKVLSIDSRRSLVLQGGPMDVAECFAFRQLPHAMDAVRLRHWDEAAKRPGQPTPALEAYWALVSACQRH